MTSRLSPIQAVILEFVRAYPISLKRSEIAKILAGSQSARTVDFQKSDYFGQPSQFKRKTILQDVHIMIEQGLLSIDKNNAVSLPQRKVS